MKKGLVVWLAAGFCVAVLSVATFADQLNWKDIGRENRNFLSVLVVTPNRKIILAGTNKAILRSEDAGENWRNILFVKGQNRAVNFLTADPKNVNCLYAATGNGVYFSDNQGKSWRRIFQGRNYLENDCAAVAVTPGVIYAGTKQGLFESVDRGRTWQKQPGRLGANQILAIASDTKDAKLVFVGSSDGVYTSKNSGETWKRVLVANYENKNNEFEEQPQEEGEGKDYLNLKYIVLDGSNHCIYAATLKGVYKSEDRGTSWERLSNYGLLEKEIRFLAISADSSVYAVTKLAVFKYEGQRWQEMSVGLGASQINFLSLDNRNNLYVACDRGLYKGSIGDIGKMDVQNDLVLYSEGEPTIQEVQRAAIKYAEVDQNKILQWRKQAAKKAFLPRFTAGVNRDTSDLWHWESGSSTKAYDDVLIRGKETIGWDVNLTWELGDIVWSENQMSIDVRSRLMVQLRQDILDEVTKTYFERLRVKMELANLAIEDKRKRQDKELKLSELTAMIDSLTDGYFSRNLKEKT